MSISALCESFEISRQGYYQGLKQYQMEAYQSELIINEIARLRTTHKRKGGRKLFRAMKNFFKEHNIKMGRDQFFGFLGTHKKWQRT